MFYPKRYSSWPHVCHIILKVSFFLLSCSVIFVVICYHYFLFILVIWKRHHDKKKRDKMIIFIAGISMEFSSQFGYITTRGIAAQLFLKILKSVFSKNVCMLLPNWGKPLFFWMQEISSEQHKWKVSLYVQFQKNTRSPTFRPIFLCQFPNFYSSLYTDF